MHHFDAALLPAPSCCELVCELRDDVPTVSRGCTRDRFCESVISARLGALYIWPNVIQLTRTYVDSRRVSRTRVDVNRRESNDSRAFESRPLR